jgi:leucyl aminopeptidase (aminopeptidase T)
VIHPDTGPKLSRAADVLTREMMCIKQGESVLITADSGSDMDAIRAIQDSSYRLGAKTATVLLSPQLPFQGAIADQYLPDHVKAATNECDVWIDLCMPYLAGSKAYARAMKNNRTRYFLGADIGSEELVRLLGRASLDRIFALSDAFAGLVERAAGKECRMTNAAGTDVSCVLAKTEALALAKATRPGGYFVPGTVVLIPELESVRGTIVARSGFHEYYTEFAEPITFEVDGKVREVTGGGPENKVMRRALARAGNGDFGYIVHLTCGVHPAARYTGKCFVEDQRVTGYNAIGLGLPPWMEGGGENHPDAIVAMQSMWIDGKQIVKEGVIVAPKELAALAAELQPIYA